MGMTPNMEVIFDYVKLEYGNSIGVYKCRKIAGSQTYSQHSWSNAVDIYTSNKDMQDEIALDLEDWFGDYIRNILTWRYNSAHWNHLHVDMWPKGWLTPPCAGGTLRVKNKDGSISNEFSSNLGDDDMAILTDSEQKDLKRFLGYIEAMNSDVSYVKQDIADVRERNAGGPWLPAADYEPSDVVDDQARIVAANAHVRLDKLKDI